MTIELPWVKPKNLESTFLKAISVVDPLGVKIKDNAAMFIDQSTTWKGRDQMTQLLSEKFDLSSFTVSLSILMFTWRR